MVNGFQMYLDEHDGKLGGATVKFIVEMTRALSTATCMAKKLILQDKVDMLVGACFAQQPMHWRRFRPRKRRSSSLPSPPGTTLPASIRQISLHHLSTSVSSQPTHALGNGLASKAISASPRSAPITPSGTGGWGIPEGLRGLRR